MHSSHMVTHGPHIDAHGAHVGWKFIEKLP